MTSIEWKNATPAQHNLWKYASGLIAYTTITPIYYMGAYAASEFTVYSADKIYIALHLIFTTATNTNPLPQEIIICNQANVGINVLNNSFPYWDVTAAALRLFNQVIEAKDLYFSRVISSYGNTQMKFNGYRLTV